MIELIEATELFHIHRRETTKNWGIKTSNDGQISNQISQLNLKFFKKKI